MKSYLFAIVILLFTIFTNAAAQKFSVGEQAPKIELNRFNGGSLSTDNYSNKILFVNFFGSY
jgi:hypothetical protein